MQVRSGRAGGLEFRICGDSESAKVSLNDTLNRPESGLYCGMPDGAQRVVPVADGGDSFSLAGLALQHPEDLADLEGVKGGRLAIEIEPQGGDQTGQQAAAHLGKLGGKRIGHAHRITGVEPWEALI